MEQSDLEIYKQIRDGRAGFYEDKRSLMSVNGKEAVQFLDGMITNDMKILEDGQQMLAAFPNAQGRLLALVRIQRQGESFLIETEDVTREKLHQNLFRFTFAGDFFVEDLSEQYSYFEIFGPKEDVYNPEASEYFPGAFAYELPYGAAYFIPNDGADDFRGFLVDENGCMTITDKFYETLRIESGVPLSGIDVDETTIVPELGLEGMISYTKGCYIGQEIIARIHFRGHVAKQLTGLILDTSASEPSPATGFVVGAELTSIDGKNAGRITSVTYSPKLERTIALGFVRYDYLAEGTELRSGENICAVKELPFV
jgi:folate-binding protein YgfZ